MFYTILFYSHPQCLAFPEGLEVLQQCNRTKLELTLVEVERVGLLAKGEEQGKEGYNIQVPFLQPMMLLTTGSGGREQMRHL